MKKASAGDMAFVRQTTHVHALAHREAAAMVRPYTVRSGNKICSALCEKTKNAKLYLIDRIINNSNSDTIRRKIERLDLNSM